MNKNDKRSNQRNNQDIHDKEVRDLINQDKSTPVAPKGEWTHIFSSLEKEVQAHEKNSFLSSLSSQYWPALGGGMLAFMMIGFLVYPRSGEVNSSYQHLSAQQKEHLVRYLFEEVGPNELSDDDEVLPGLNAL